MAAFGQNREFHGNLEAFLFEATVSALTLGYVREVSRHTWGGVGGDLTGYVVPANLKESYGSPVSFHVFLRYRGRAGTIGHVH